jgi:hypothetical protein
MRMVYKCRHFDTLPFSVPFSLFTAAYMNSMIIKLIIQHSQLNHFQNLISLLLTQRSYFKYTLKFLGVVVKYYKMMKNQPNTSKTTFKLI